MFDKDHETLVYPCTVTVAGSWGFINKPVPIRTLPAVSQLRRPCQIGFLCVKPQVHGNLRQSKNMKSNMSSSSKLHPFEKPEKKIHQKGRHLIHPPTKPAGHSFAKKPAPEPISLMASPNLDTGFSTLPAKPLPTPRTKPTKKRRSFRPKKTPGSVCTKKHPTWRKPRKKWCFYFHKGWFWRFNMLFFCRFSKGAMTSNKLQMLRISWSWLY